MNEEGKPSPLAIAI